MRRSVLNAVSDAGVAVFTSAGGLANVPAAGGLANVPATGGLAGALSVRTAPAGTDSEEWRNSGLGEAQEKACNAW